MPDSTSGKPRVTVDPTLRGYEFTDYVDVDEMWDEISANNGNPAYENLTYAGFGTLELPIVKDAHTFRLMYAVAWLTMEPEKWPMDAIAGLFNYIGLVPFAYRLDELENKFRDAYLGEWDSRARYGRCRFDDFAPPSSIGGVLAGMVNEYMVPLGEYYGRVLEFVDWDAYARSLEPDTFYVDAPNGKVYVYRDVD